MYEIKELKWHSWRGRQRHDASSPLGVFQAILAANEEDWMLRINGVPIGLYTSLDAAKSVAQADYTTRMKEGLEEVGGQTREELDARMKSLGMLTITELVDGEDPLGKFSAHAGVRNHATFEEWLKMRYEEILKSRMPYELGDQEEDELYEWIFGHAGAFAEVLANWKQMKIRMGSAPHNNEGSQT